MKTYVVTPQNQLIETVLERGHNIFLWRNTGKSSLLNYLKH